MPSPAGPTNRTAFRSTIAGLGLAALLAATGCTSNPYEVESNLTPSTAPQSGRAAQSTFPYNPLIYNLDLAILAYQLYGQSLAWPYDPYYEEHGGTSAQRDATMMRVHTWAGQTGLEQRARPAGLNGYRGPGSLNGFPDNIGHDPIIYSYGNIYPWHNTLTNADGKFTEYLTPKKITAQIKSAFVCYRPAGADAGSSAIKQIEANRGGPASGASNILLAFEGGTGDKGEANQPASQSLMGFVLVREKPGGAYDLHISFRGSRSGSAARAVLEAFSDGRAKGNPDWITDLGYNRLSSGQGAASVSTIGKVHRGFVRSMQSIHPNLFHCLKQAAKIKRGKSPDSLYVTGHSLGGALAQAFVSSVLLGNRYGPDGQGGSMPTALRNWPWKNVKLVSFSAPRIGDEQFARTLTQTKLQSEFFSTQLNPIDTSALRPNDPAILRRLLDKSRPAGFRVLHSKDPITTEKGAGGKHVGKTVYVNKFSVGQIFSAPSFKTHEQRVIRDLMRSNIADNSVPALAMRYRSMSDINPTRDKSKKGSAEELAKMVAAIKKYYANQNIAIDEARFDRHLATRLQIERAK
ncbi:MAG: lipase family protein [Rhizobiaceae bacterium]